MYYVSIDLETTGLDPDWCQILEMGAVLGDTTGEINVEEAPSFHAYVCHNHLRGEPYALSMHAALLRRIATREPGYTYLREEELSVVFERWLREQGVEGRVWVAGKNFGAFDLPFLRQAGGFDGLFHHRFLDPAMLFFDPETHTQIPDLQTCLDLGGLQRTVSHTALDDARDVIRVLQAAWARLAQAGNYQG